MNGCQRKALAQHSAISSYRDSVASLEPSQMIPFSLLHNNDNNNNNNKKITIIITELVQEIGRRISAITKDNTETAFLFQRRCPWLCKNSSGVAWVIGAGVEAILPPPKVVKCLMHSYHPSPIFAVITSTFSIFAAPYPDCRPGRYAPSAPSLRH